jgi:hypothetical protein
MREPVRGVPVRVNAVWEPVPTAWSIVNPTFDVPDPVEIAYSNKILAPLVGMDGAAKLTVEPDHV